MFSGKGFTMHDAAATLAAAKLLPGTQYKIGSVSSQNWGTDGLCSVTTLKLWANATSEVQASREWRNIKEYIEGLNI